MKILGMDGLTSRELRAELEKGAKFVIYQFCVSILVMTFKRPSDIYFVRAAESAVRKGLGFSLISLLFGWWGLPWGPIYTIASVITNTEGGKDVTEEVVAYLDAPDIQTPFGEVG